MGCFPSWEFWQAPDSTKNQGSLYYLQCMYCSFVQYVQTVAVVHVSYCFELVLLTNTREVQPESVATMKGLQKPRRFMQLHRPHWRWNSKDVSPRPEDVDSFARDMPSFRAAPPGPTQYDNDERRFRPKDEVGAEYVLEETPRALGLRKWLT